MKYIYPTTLLRLYIQPTRLFLASWLLLTLVAPAFATNTITEKTADKEKGRTPDKPLKTHRVTSTPTITALSPIRNQRNAPASTSIGITFSEAMNATTASSTAIKVFGSRTGKRSGTFSGGGTALATFAPGNAFKAGEVVSVTTTTAAQNTGGTALANAHVYTFTTAAATAPANFIANSPLLSTGSQPHGVYPADIDGDGDMDLAFANGGKNYLSVRKNNGDATFATSDTVGLPVSAEAIFSADLDGDGDMDLAAAGLGNLMVRMNDGAGNFSDGVNYANSSTIGGTSFDVTGGDFDGDGDIDLAVPVKNQLTISIFTNNGLGIFTRSIAAGGSDPYGICAADFDKDGDIDLAVTNNTSLLVTIKMNDGTGFFSGSSTVATGSNAQSIQAADFDGDGDVDLAAASVGSNTVSVRLNNGTGSFSGSTEVAVGTQPYGVYAADLDGDGDMDIATANRGSNDMSVCLNDGTGNFSGATNITTGGTQAYALQAADFDGDNDLDIAVVNSGSSRCTMFLNRLPTGSNTSPTITTVANQSVCADNSSAALAFTVGDAETAAASLTVTATSSNTTLVPNSGLVLGGSGANLTITVTPAFGQTGSTTITLTVTDGNAASTSSTFTLTVNPSPTVNAGLDQAVCVDVPGVNLTGAITVATGGVWSSSGTGTFSPNATTLNATYLPSASDKTVGSVALTLTTTGNGLCQAVSDQMNIIFMPAPTVDAGANQVVCANAAAFTLTGFSPAGGTWSGNGVNASGTFTPSASLVGTQTLTYSITQSGCTNSATKTITVNAAPVATFSYAGPYCVNSGSNPSPTFSGGGTAGTFSSTAGLTINATTGVITLASSTPGTYTVTNTIAAANGCSAVSATATVTINAAPVATFNYTGPYCSGTNPSPTFSGGGVAGTFTSTAGLSINASTGVIDLTASTPGTYTVTNTIAATSGCSSVSATATVIINATPVATFAYAGPYCVSGGANPSPTFSGGGVAGTFASSAGLSINASTGVIDLAASTLGTYSVTNTVNQNGCVALATASVTITAAPVATFGYAGPYCVNGGSNPSPTFSGGGIAGTFSSTAGLTINATTGVITLANSTPGTYTVTNAIAAANGCSAASATATVTITAAPVATFSYAGPYCVNGGSNPAPTFSGGGTAGTFSSTTGLSLNASTGVIDLAASTPGMYTVTNTIPAANGCQAVSATATVTINAAPVATFAYAGPYCVNSGSNPSPAFNGGGVAGTFTSTAGLSINATTGVIDLATSTPGTYTVTNTVTQNGCTDSATSTVTISPSLDVTGTFVDNTDCLAPNGSITLTVTGGTASFTFDWGNGISTQNRTGLAAGTYTVTVIDAGGCSATQSFTLSDPNAPATFAVTGGGTDCQGSAGFNVGLAGSENGVSYQLLQDGSPVNTAITGTGSALDFGLQSTAGTYTVSAKNTGGCTSVMTGNATIVIEPQPSLSIVDPAPACAPTTIDLTTLTITDANSAEGTFSYWTDAAATSALSNPDAVATSGTYYVKKTTTGGCSDIKPVVVSINATITADAGPNQNVCAGDAAFTLTDFSPAGGTWSGNGVDASGLFTPSASLVGTQTLTYTIDQNGCSAIATKTITVTEAPDSPTANANSPTAGETLNLTASDVANATYQWTGPNGFTSTQQNPTIPNVTISAAGAYSVTATINGCTSAAGTVDVVITPPVLPASVTVMLDSVAAQSGSSVVVPVRVKDFNNILAAQGSIQWNTTVASFVGVEQFGLPGMTASDFGTTQTSSGALVFAWSDAALQTHTLPDNAIVFAIRFNLVGGTGTSSAVTLSNSPTVVEIIGAGNQSIPTNSLAGKISIISVVSVAGKVKSPTGATINGVSLKVSGGPTAPTFTTAADGAFQLNVMGGQSFTVSAFKNNDIVSANGITTLDLILIQRHILGLAPLTTPYKLIAADVNQSGTITTLDIVLTRSLILQNTTSFPGNRLWTFVRSDYAFPNPANPFPYDSTRTYTSGSSYSAQDFTGVRLGDVNDTWNSNIARTGTFGEISFQLPDKQVLPGEEITIPVRVGGFSGVSGYQFTLNWNPQVLEFVEVQHGALKGNYGYNRVTEGKLTTSWQEGNGKSLTLPDDSTAFFVRFKVTGALGSQSYLAINSDLTASEAYDEQFQPLSVTSAARTISVGEQPEPTLYGYELYPSQPNPFSDHTTIRFSVPQPESVSLAIYNSLGQLVKTFNQHYVAGEHQVRWNGDSGSGAKLSSGTYFVQMRAGKFVKGIKVVLAE